MISTLSPTFHVAFESGPVTVGRYVTAAAAISNLELALLPTVKVKHKRQGQEKARDGSLLTKYDPGATDPGTVKPTDPVAESKFCDRLVMRLSFPSLPVLYRSTDTKLPVVAGTLLASLYTTQFMNCMNKHMPCTHQLTTASFPTLQMVFVSGDVSDGL